VLTPIPYDVLEYVQKTQVIKGERSLLPINAKDPYTAIEIARGLVHEVDMHKLAGRIVMFGFRIRWGETIASLHQYLSSFKNYVHVLPYLPHKDLLNMLSKSLLLIYTSHGEGMPTLVLEALA